MGASWKSKRFGLTAFLALVAVLIVACGGATPTPTLAPTPTSPPPTATAEPTPTPSPTDTPTPEPPTATPEPINTPTLEVVPEPTATPAPTDTPQPTPTVGAGAPQSRPPHIFVGTAMIDRQPAREGTIVTAMIGGQEVGKAVVEGDEGQFTLQVGVPGQTVTFLVDTYQAGETATTEVGGADMIELTASSQ